MNKNTYTCNENATLNRRNTLNKFNLYIGKSEKEALNKLLKSEIILTHDMHYKVYSGATILPTNNEFWPPRGGVRDNQGQWIPESTAWNFEDDSKYIIEDVVESNDEAIYLGSFASIYGHTFTDNLAKVWYILDNPANNYKIAYSAYWNKGKIPQYISDFFSLLNLDINSFIHVTRPIKFAKVIIPESTFIRHTSKDSPAFVHIRMKRIYEEIIKNANSLNQYKSPVPKKIYFSRTNPNRRNPKLRDIGETSLISLFKRQGYEIIYPEELSIPTQIQLLSNCDEFCTTEGSISHNSVFVNGSTTVTILKKSDWINPYQLALSLLMNNQTNFIDCHHSISTKKSKTPHAGPFYLECTRQLELYIGHKIPRVTRWIKPIWWFYYLIRSRTYIIKLYRMFSKFKFLKF